ncbi:redoxin [Roseivirga pacifica]|uniref:Redoxin n=1 Tax=Roseivirga pacifica TaxID=1267423 RepID=A0A1I0R6D2_9BACT|nr:TlpA disulfide reductase family protein [Roseivirga pacifica]RKQ49082.1 redoxin [Roseivirga pacifica]SEW35935.1 Redoxin [Roseivirga pacifica]
MRIRLSYSSIFLCLLAFSVAVSCNKTESTNNQVTLSGKLINWGNASRILNSNALEADFGLGEDHKIETDEQGSFSLSFDLNKPTYFSLGRNKLYLQPGGELYIEVNYRDPEAAVFKGECAHLQAYLSGVAFPKSGSYLEGGSNLNSDDVMETVHLAKEKTEERRMLLNQLDAPKEFIALEEMRLKLDEMNTILSMPIYGSFKGYWDVAETQKFEVLQSAKSVLNELSEGIMDDDYMKHPNFRDMMYEFVDAQMHENGIFSGLKFTAFMNEYDALGALVKQMELEGLTENIQQQANNFMAAEHSAEYKEMVQAKLAEYEKLIPGKRAMDVVFANALGEEVPLSNFKGKLIYVDLWATWCGPCIEELPAFEQLKADYAGKNVAFVPVSIDTNLEQWQKYLTTHNLPKEKEYLINRLDLSDYKVITIPRYLLIDSDFNIVSVFAPKPSLPETRTLLDLYFAEE